MLRGLTRLLALIGLLAAALPSLAQTGDASLAAAEAFRERKFEVAVRAARCFAHQAARAAASGTDGQRSMAHGRRQVQLSSDTIAGTLMRSNQPNTS